MSEMILRLGIFFLACSSVICDYTLSAITANDLTFVGGSSQPCAQFQGPAKISFNCSTTQSSAAWITQKQKLFYGFSLSYNHSILSPAGAGYALVIQTKNFTVGPSSASFGTDIFTSSDSVIFLIQNSGLNATVSYVTPSGTSTPLVSAPLNGGVSFQFNGSQLSITTDFGIGVLNNNLSTALGLPQNGSAWIGFTSSTISSVSENVSITNFTLRNIADVISPTSSSSSSSSSSSTASTILSPANLNVANVVTVALLTATSSVSTSSSSISTSSVTSISSGGASSSIGTTSTSSSSLETSSASDVSSSSSSSSDSTSSDSSTSSDASSTSSSSSSSSFETSSISTSTLSSTLTSGLTSTSSTSSSTTSSSSTSGSSTSGTSTVQPPVLSSFKTCSSVDLVISNPSVSSETTLCNADVKIIGNLSLIGAKSLVLNDSQLAIDGSLLTDDSSVITIISNGQDTDYPIVATQPVVLNGSLVIVIDSNRLTPGVFAIRVINSSASVENNLDVSKITINDVSKSTCKPSISKTPSTQQQQNSFTVFIIVDQPSTCKNEQFPKWLIAVIVVVGCLSLFVAAIVAFVVKKRIDNRIHQRKTLRMSISLGGLRI